MCVEGEEPVCDSYVFHRCVYTVQKWHALKIYFKLRNCAHLRRPDTRNCQVQTDSLCSGHLTVAVTSHTLNSS